jgi:hypothetical protein
LPQFVPETSTLGHHLSRSSSTAQTHKAVAPSGCADKAIDKNGKPLAGAAKNSFMKKCEADAKGGK